MNDKWVVVMELNERNALKNTIIETEDSKEHIDKIYITQHTHNKDCRNT